jgi:tryptophanyl-tRNA synthetase
MRSKDWKGNYGYGQSKQELYELIVRKYETEREGFNFYFDNKAELEKKLQQGEDKARAIALETLGRVRKKLGFV